MPSNADAQTTWEAITHGRPATVVTVAVLPVTTAGGAIPGDAMAEAVALTLMQDARLTVVDRLRTGLLMQRRDEGSGPYGALSFLGARYQLAAHWSAAGDTEFVEVRLVESTTGRTAAHQRRDVGAPGGPVQAARAAADAAVAALTEAGALAAEATPVVRGPHTGAATPAEAWAAFVLAVEQDAAGDWLQALQGYERAARLGTGAFREAEAAVVRSGRILSWLGSTMAGDPMPTAAPAPAPDGPPPGEWLGARLGLRGIHISTGVGDVPYLSSDDGTTLEMRFGITLNRVPQLRISAVYGELLYPKPTSYSLAADPNFHPSLNVEAGGVEVQWNFRPARRLGPVATIGVGTITSAYRYGYRDENRRVTIFEDEKTETGYLLAAVGGELRVFRWLRMSGTAGYRFAADLVIPGAQFSQRGPVVAALYNLGKF